MKQRPAFLSFLIAALVVQAMLFASPAAHAKDILFINPGFADKGFWHAVGATMKAAAKEFGFNLSIVSADRKWPVMLSKGLDAITNTDVDYLIIVNEHQQAPVLLKAAHERDIPTLLLLNDLTDEQQEDFGKPRTTFGNWIGSITPDNEIAGYEMAVSILGDQEKRGVPTVNLLTLAGDFKTPASIARLRGLDRALQEPGRTVEEVRRLTVNWSEEEAYERTRRVLESAQLNAVWAANDPIAFGAIRALRERGLKPGKDVSVAGLNWSIPAIDAVIDGELTLSHGGHFMAGAWSIVLIADYDRGVDFADVGTHVRFPMSAMTQDNARRYKEALGDQNWSKIEFRSFSRQGGANTDGYDFTLSKVLSSLK